MSPEFSVIVPTLGDSPHLRAALSSALANDADLEVLLVHDRRLGAPRLGDGYLEDPRVRLVVSHSAGPGAARNAGMRVARGARLAFLDDDDLWLPSHLSWAEETIRLHPETVLATSDARVFEDPTQDGSASPPENIDGLPRFRSDLAGGPVPLRTLLLANPILTPAVVLVREKLLPSDCFDERLSVMEDYDLWLKLAARGEIVFDPRPGILIRRRGGSASRDWRTMAENSIEILNKALALGLRQGAVTPSQARRRLAALWHDLAYACLVEEDLAEGRRALRESISRLPLWPKNYIYWLSTTLPASIRRGLFSRGMRIRGRNFPVRLPGKVPPS